MDNKKTGALIAKRRQEMGLTQKELGEQLHISDRAVSKWERAVGFPDVSLLEPLAEALGISVLELLRGEELAGEEQPSPEVRYFIHSVMQELSDRLKKSFGRYRRIIIVLSILLVISVAAIVYLRFGPFQAFSFQEREISAAEALETVPHSIITTDDFTAARQLLDDPEVGGLLVQVPSDSIDSLPPNGIDYCVTIDEAITASYRELFRVEGRAADNVTIEVIYNTIVVRYLSENSCCILNIVYNGPILKIACTYTDEGEVDGAIVSNENNEYFTSGHMVWDLLKSLPDAESPDF